MTEEEWDYYCKTNNTEGIACPYCLEAQSDIWEFGHDSEDSQAFCSSCGKEFNYSVHVTYTYITSKLEESCYE